MTKEQIVLFIFFLLVIKNQWKIITVLIFIYFYFSINNNVKETKISDEVKKFNTELNNINYYSSDDYYYNKYMKLEALINKYPIEFIRYEQIKVINGMLTQIPITPEVESKWLSIRKELLSFK
jgi:hypothetical protein